MMDPRDFLHLAKKLCSGNTEAERRTAVSRSYYAVYNLMAKFFRDKDIPVPLAAEGHEKVSQYVNNSGIPEAAKLSGAIGNLRGARNDADYELDQIDFNHKISALWVAEAQRLISIFEKCDREKLTHGVRTYLTRISPPTR